MIFLGVNNINAEGNNTMTANGGLIILNTSPEGAGAITLGSNANINATAPGPTVINSLDLSNSIAVGVIQALQASGTVSGTLTTLSTTYDAYGNAILTTSGNVVAANTALTPTITAVNILSGDTATLSGYTGGTSGTPLNVNLTSSSSTQSFEVSGALQFTGTGISPAVVVTTNLGNTSSLVQVNAGGSITSTGSLTVNAQGGMVVNGTLNASSLTLQTTANNGGISMASSSSGANLTATSGSVNLTTQGSGSIMQTGAYTAIAAGTVNLSSAGGSIGSTGNNIMTATSELSVNAGGSAFVTNNGALTVNQSAAGNQLEITTTGSNAGITTAGTLTASTGLLQLAASGNIVVNNVLSGDSLTLQTNSASNGSITLNTEVTGTTGTTTIYAGGSGNIVQNAGTIYGDTVNLQSDTGNIGTDPTAGGAAINTAATTALSANTSVNGTGTVFINQAGGVTLNSSSAGGNFSLTVTGTGSTTVGSVATGNGSITVDTSSSGSALNVAANANISANEGNVYLENDNTSTGTILIGNGATISATTGGATLGQVLISIGTPGIGVSGVAPANTIANPVDGGQIFFGNNGISDVGPTNSVNADGGTVIFNTNNSANTAILLNGGATINATAVQTGGGPLNSLDLTNPSVTSEIESLIGGGLIGGSLTLNSSGAATGGTITIAPSVLARTLVGENIPQGVTVDLSGFTSGNRVNIVLTSSSYTLQAIISGNEEFTGGGIGLVNINSSNQSAGPVLLINKTGLLSSDGGLMYAANGRHVDQWGGDGSDQFDPANHRAQRQYNDWRQPYGHDIGCADCAGIGQHNAHGNIGNGRNCNWWRGVV